MLRQWSNNIHRRHTKYRQRWHARPTCKRESHTCVIHAWCRCHSRQKMKGNTGPPRMECATKKKKKDDFDSRPWVRHRSRDCYCRRHPKKRRHSPLLPAGVVETSRSFYSYHAPARTSRWLNGAYDAQILNLMKGTNTVRSGTFANRTFRDQLQWHNSVHIVRRYKSFRFKDNQRFQQRPLLSAIRPFTQVVPDHFLRPNQSILEFKTLNFNEKRSLHLNVFTFCIQCELFTH